MGTMIEEVNDLMGKIIEIYANHPSLEYDHIAAMFNLNAEDVKQIIEKHYIGPGDKGKIVSFFSNFD